MTKRKPVVSMLDEVNSQVRAVFSEYFNTGWADYGRIWPLVAPGPLGLANIGKLLRLECRRQRVPFVRFSVYDINPQNWLHPKGPIRMDPQLKCEVRTLPLLRSLVFLDRKVVGYSWPLDDGIPLGNLCSIGSYSAEIAETVRALLDQQAFTAKIRAIGAEHYPPR